jgi:hypothetical protein
MSRAGMFGFFDQHALSAAPPGAIILESTLPSVILTGITTLPQHR